MKPVEIYVSSGRLTPASPSITHSNHLDARVRQLPSVSPSGVSGKCLVEIATQHQPSRCQPTPPHAPPGTGVFARFEPTCWRRGYSFDFGVRRQNV